MSVQFLTALEQGFVRHNKYFSQIVQIKRIVTDKISADLFNP
ncbi:hypothetical protein GCM10027085_16780 [Spirosoma aerophilum]